MVWQPIICSCPIVRPGLHSYRGAPPVAPLLARRRWRALSCAAIAVTVVGIGCRDAFTGPSGSTLKHEAPKAPRATMDPGGGESPPSVTISLGSPDLYDG